MKNSMYRIMKANELAAYDRAIAQYPHLAGIRTAKAFCQALSNLQALETISAAEYMEIGRIATGLATRK